MSLRLTVACLPLLALAFPGISLGAGYKALKREELFRLSDGFSALPRCEVKGETEFLEEDDANVLLAKGEVEIAVRRDFVLPYSVAACVKLSPRRWTAGRSVLACGLDEKARYEIELLPSPGHIDIRVLHNGRNLWGPSTYKYREGRGANSLRYHVRLDPKQLLQKLEGMEKGLAGRQEEWKEWGLGIRGEFFEESAVAGIKKLIVENDVQPLPHQRWTQFRVDVTREAVRMFVDSRFVGEVVEPAAPAQGVSLRLARETRLRSLEIARLRQQPDEFLTVDAAGHYNARSELAAAMPPGVLVVKGIPFVTGEGQNTLNCIDVGKSGPLETGFGKGFMHSPFESASGLIRHPARSVALIPKGWYTKLYLLAYSERKLGAEPVVSFRFFRSQRTGTIIDYTCSVPYADERPKRGTVSSIRAPSSDGAEGWLHIVEVPLEPCLTQSYLEKDYFRSLQFEITKGLHFTRGYPDPWNYISVPAGPPSSVKIVGMTFRRSPLEMIVTTDEVGHFVVQPEKPYLNVLLRNGSPDERRVTLTVDAEDAHGERVRATHKLKLPGECSLAKRLLLPLRKYGIFRLNVTARNGDLTLTKRTSLGYLPPDTRRAGWGDSAFGVWCWGAGVGGYSYPTNSEETMRLIWKLGGRWALNPADPKIAEKYGITNAWGWLMRKFDFDKVPKEKWEEELKKAMLEGLKNSYRHQDLFLVFGEANLGLKQTYALPGPYYGEPDYELNEKEQAKFERFFQQVSLYGKVLKQLKKEHPKHKNVKLTFGNTSPNFHIEFLKRGLPPEYIDVFGIDIPYFERMPERQPRAVEGSQLLYLQDYRKKAGLEHIPIMGTEDMYYPGCPGSLSQREQADYYARGHLLKFAMGVTREASVAMVFSTSGPYGRGHYGATGFFEVAPEGGGDGNPRESAVAYATMTRVLDAAKFVKHLPTGSTSTFCLGFSRKLTKEEVLVLWTIHGKRPVRIHLATDLEARVTDQWGNTSPISAKDKVLEVSVSSSPVYVLGVRLAQVEEVRAGPPTYTARPSVGYAMLDDFETPWRKLDERDLGYEENCFDLPKFKGEMSAETVTSFDGSKAFEVALQKPPKERKLAPWYTMFVPPKPIPVPGRPTKIGVYVKGNSGWGRIIPQVTDAKGEVWTFIGPKDAWNADDIRSQSSVNFDGWKYMEMELPNTLPNRWPGPALAFWENDKGDRVVDYPLSLTKIYIEQYTHNYYVNEIVPVPEAVLTLDRFVCTYDDPYADWHLTKGW